MSSSCGLSIENVNLPGVDLLFQIEAEGFGIADDLRGVLIERNQQAALFLLSARLRSKSWVPSTVFPAPETPTTMVVDPSKTPPPIKSSRACTPITERLAVEVGCARFAPDGSLNAAEHFQPLAGRNSQRVLAGHIVLPAALDDLDAAVAPRRLYAVAVQLDYGVGQETGRFQGSERLGEPADLVRKHGGQILAVQPLDQLL